MRRSPSSTRSARRRRARLRALFDLRGWLFLGMGLGGILTIALIVSADESYAGIDGLRAVRAILPAAAVSSPSAVPTGLAAVQTPGPSSSRPAKSPPVATDPSPVADPAAQQPAASRTPPASNITLPASPAASPSPVPSPAPSASPSAAPAPGPITTPSPTPLPPFAIATDLGSTALFDLTGLVPGDSISRTLTVRNAGALAFRYSVSASQTASTLLWTDATNGLQLTVSTSGGTVLYSGALAALGTLAGPSVLAPGATELLRYTVAFPPAAPNGYQGLSQDLSLVLTAVQYP